MCDHFQLVEKVAVWISPKFPTELFMGRVRVCPCDISEGCHTANRGQQLFKQVVQRISGLLRIFVTACVLPKQRSQFGGWSSVGRCAECRLAGLKPVAEVCDFPIRDVFSPLFTAAPRLAVVMNTHPAAVNFNSAGGALLASGYREDHAGKRRAARPALKVHGNDTGGGGVQPSARCSTTTVV